MSCGHLWREIRVMTPTTSQVACEKCGVRGYAKARQADNDYAFTVATERVCMWLMELLRARGVPVRAPAAELARPLGHELRHGPSGYATGPWYCWASVTYDLEPVAQIGYHDDPAGVQWPGWLYHFDRWVCRTDGWGGNNFVLSSDNHVIPLDFGCAFGWALGVSFARKLDDLTIPAHPQVFAAADPATVTAIKTITDDDLWNATVKAGIPTELAPTALLVAWWSGLCLRRDLL